MKLPSNVIEVNNILLKGPLVEHLCGTVEPLQRFYYFSVMIMHNRSRRHAVFLIVIRGTVLSIARDLYLSYSSHCIEIAN